MVVTVATTWLSAEKQKEKIASIKVPNITNLYFPFSQQLVGNQWRNKTTTQLSSAELELCPNNIQY